jgi:IS30 family transposase
MILISDRPAEVADRTVPGQPMGRRPDHQQCSRSAIGTSGIGTLAERPSRFLMLVHLPTGYVSIATRSALIETVKTMSSRLMRSITWGQGSETAADKTSMLSPPSSTAVHT